MLEKLSVLEENGHENGRNIEYTRFYHSILDGINEAYKSRNSLWHNLKPPVNAFDVSSKPNRYFQLQ